MGMSPSGTLRDFLRKESPTGIETGGESLQREKQSPPAVSHYKPVTREEFIQGPPKMAWSSMLPHKGCSSPQGRQASALLRPGSSQSTSASAQATSPTNR